LARPSIDPAHDALHAIERGAVQGLLAIGGLKKVRRRVFSEVGGAPPPHAISQLFGISGGASTVMTNAEGGPKCAPWFRSQSR
jgi:hypothetical protein